SSRSRAIAAASSASGGRLVPRGGAVVATGGAGIDCVLSASRWVSRRLCSSRRLTSTATTPPSARNGRRRNRILEPVMGLDAGLIRIDREDDGHPHSHVSPGFALVDRA